MAEEDSGVRIVLKEFPVHGAGSLMASRAALASKAQGKYLDFHRALFRAGRKIDEEKIMKIGASLGLDTVQLKEDMEAPGTLAIVDRNKALAKSLGIWRTPSMVVGNEVRIGATSYKGLEKLTARARS